MKRPAERADALLQKADKHFQCPNVISQSRLHYGAKGFEGLNFKNSPLPATWYLDRKKSNPIVSWGIHVSPLEPGKWYQIIAFYQIAGMIDARLCAPRSLKTSSGASHGSQSQREMSAQAKKVT
ncbi:MAG TPA: hypothetical protein VK699_08885 [Terriglobales bacterium]|jgi:hypothetical protein|nr:hypothetical protein [Terriglobales bacterium]